MGAWTEQRPDGTVVVVGPDACPNGHSLVPPNVRISSNTRFISYGCGRCRAWINRLHDERVEWVSQGYPAPF